MNDILPLREPIKGTTACPTAVRALRECFRLLIADHADPRFTGRLMQIVAEILRRDVERERGRRSVYFSKEMPFLSTIVFNKRSVSDENLLRQFIYSHSDTRTSARLSVEALNFKNGLNPGATHFRILNHLSIISDYCYHESSRLYEPQSRWNGINVMEFSEYMEIADGCSVEIEVSLPVWCHPSEDDSVIHCMGIEFYVKSGLFEFRLMGKKSGVMICEVF